HAPKILPRRTYIRAGWPVSAETVLRPADATLAGPPPLPAAATQGSPQLALALRIADRDGCRGTRVRRDEVAVNRERRLRLVGVVEQPVVMLEVERRAVVIAEIEPAVVADVVGAAKLVDGARHLPQGRGLGRLVAKRAGRPPVLLDVDRDLGAKS